MEEAQSDGSTEKSLLLPSSEAKAAPLSQFSLDNRTSSSFSHAVLLVEDSTDDAFALQRTFGKAGLANPIHVVESVDLAIAYLSGHGMFSDRQKFPMPSILMVDLRLPGRSGFDLLEWVQKTRDANLLVVALSGFEDSGAVARAYELGAKSFLRKPYEIDPIRNLTHFFQGYWKICDPEGG
jgi:DNA-binding response OmpR family regulator